MAQDEDSSMGTCLKRGGNNLGFALKIKKDQENLHYEKDEGYRLGPNGNAVHITDWLWTGIAIGADTAETCNLV